MKISVQTHFYDGAPNGTRTESQAHLVSSACLIEDPILKIIINHEGRLLCCGSTPDTVSFSFTEDDEWQGWTETEVILTGETPEEIDRLKSNQFRQTEKEQIVVAFLPWTDPANDVVLSTWNSDDLSR